MLQFTDFMLPTNETAAKLSPGIRSVINGLRHSYDLIWEAKEQTETRGESGQSTADRRGAVPLAQALPRRGQLTRGTQRAASNERWRPPGSWEQALILTALSERLPLSPAERVASSSISNMSSSKMGICCSTRVDEPISAERQLHGRDLRRIGRIMRSATRRRAKLVSTVRFGACLNSRACFDSLMRHGSIIRYYGIR